MDGLARPWPARVAALIAKAFIIAKSIYAARESKRRNAAPLSLAFLRTNAASMWAKKSAQQSIHSTPLVRLISKLAR